MSFNFKTFIECGVYDGYGNLSWTEVPGKNYLSGAYAEYDGYINDDFYVALASISDGYYSNIFKRDVPSDLSRELEYKFMMLEFLGNVTPYYLTLEEINNFNWNYGIYGSSITQKSTFAEVGSDFVKYYIPVLTALGTPNQVRIFVVKIT